MEVCKITYQDNVFAFKRDSSGEGNWVCIERKNHAMSVNLHEILHMSLQNELSRKAMANHGVTPDKLTRFLTKEKKEKKESKRQFPSLRNKMAGKVIKIFKD